MKRDFEDYISTEYRPVYLASFKATRAVLSNAKSATLVVISAAYKALKSLGVSKASRAGLLDLRNQDPSPSPKDQTAVMTLDPDAGPTRLDPCNINQFLDEIFPSSLPDYKLSAVRMKER
jgi:hypothetical protein